MIKALSIALAFFVAVIATSMAENYPSRPITIVVPFPAGGPTDALGRVLADRMKRELNEPVIVENVTGACLFVARPAFLTEIFKPLPYRRIG
jgi:tripartite-type tricarboxylate transporter receptor subunit TctC